MKMLRLFDIEVTFSGQTLSVDSSKALGRDTNMSRITWKAP